jgi:transposase, IS5 family
MLPTFTRSSYWCCDSSSRRAAAGGTNRLSLRLPIGSCEREAHVVDADSGLIHSVVCTAANESDVAHAHKLLQGPEATVGADSGYTGLPKREEITQTQGEVKLRKDIKWNIAMKPGTLRGMAEGPLKVLTQICERIKARVRGRVEHPYHVIKNLFSYRKVSCRGLAKNAARAKIHAALANLYIARRRLGPVGAGSPAAC